MPGNAEIVSTRAAITGAEPQLFVADIRASCEFFTGKLGFSVASPMARRRFTHRSVAMPRGSICATWTGRRSMPA